jgi:transcriptional regulator with XRE-family HTH domain
MTVSRTFVARETARRARQAELRIGEEIRRLRGESGVSLSALAAVVGVHRSHIARIEAGQAHPSLEVLTALGVALGADLAVRYFAGSGPRLHDRFQAAMVEACIRCLDPRWRAEVEVPVSQPVRGVIDLVLSDRLGSATVAAEAQSEIQRLEQQIRWASEKADALARRLGTEDQSRLEERVAVSRLLILRSTIATRELARVFAATLGAAYPARAADIYEALTSPTAPWPGSGIIWCQVERGQAHLMRFPPRGVKLGR